MLKALRHDPGLLRKPSVTLSIIQNSRRCDFGAEFDICEAREAAPDDNISRRRIARPGQVATQSGKFGEIKCKGSRATSSIAAPLMIRSSNAISVSVNASFGYASGVMRLSMVSQRTRQLRMQKEYKRQAVELVVSSGRSMGSVAKELGLRDSVLRRWVDKLSVTSTIGG
ncbi:transposase [Bradyrhizobium cosmicum]|uniref:transposase n=1 Tax=Bradyrhizobium cosmicum TaxID=1404864 RepID=UPI0028E25494|nr:transposase [Bradyrhizobium cosmicum]